MYFHEKLLGFVKILFEEINYGKNIRKYDFTFLRLIFKCDALRDLVAFVQFKKLEKHPWRSVNFSKVAG